MQVELLDYINQPMNTDQIQDLLKKLNSKAEDLVRKSESIYLKKFEGKSLSEQEWIAAMVEYPILIERPIFVNGDKAVIARPIERMKEIL